MVYGLHHDPRVQQRCFVLLRYQPPCDLAGPGCSQIIASVARSIAQGTIFDRVYYAFCPLPPSQRMHRIAHRTSSAFIPECAICQQLLNVIGRSMLQRKKQKELCRV